MHVAITGASGLIGSALKNSLHGDGHRVTSLVRRAPAGSDEVRWDPATGELDPESFAGVDAVVHLAGAGVGDKRWTASYKDQILRSRVDGTRTVVAAMAASSAPPPVLISGSAIGFYGDRGEEDLTEASGGGTGFLAGVTRDWEAEANRARDADIRVVTARTGLVLSPDGGMLGRLGPLVKLGLAGRIGNGRQWWSWISLHDEVRAIRHLIEHSSLDGPVNLTGPAPLRNDAFTRSLGRAAGRPTPFPVPAFALNLALGGFASDILSSSKVLPAALLDDDFVFDHADADAANRWALRSA